MAFNDYSGNCVQSDGSSGTWEIINEKLFITENGFTDEVTFFEISNNILKLGTVETDPFDDPCSATVGVSHYYTEYRRVA